MKIAIYGGSFNPPHLGHKAAAKTVLDTLCPDKLLVIPAAEPPHKQLDPGSPDGSVRLELCRLAFADMPGVEVSDLELRRPAPSYTIDTLEQLRQQYPDGEFILLMGTDMLQNFPQWRRFTDILQLVQLGVFVRSDGEEEKVCKFAANLRDTYGATVQIIRHVPVSISSTELRKAFPQRGGRTGVPAVEYAALVQRRLYGIQPELQWLREQVDLHLKPKRIPHVRGCEEEAVRLAKRWGAAAEAAAEAAILHDVTKKLDFPEQLKLCQQYGEPCTEEDRASPKTIHAKTGAVLAREVFGANKAVCDAIRWHTTARPHMRLLEKIIYMADYIEPTRDFPGVETLRQLAYSDLDAAMVLGLEMTLQEIRERGFRAHSQSVAALKWFKKIQKG